MNNKCPKCGGKLSPFYLKQNCPHCGVDLLYYKLEERLEADAAESERQVQKINHFKEVVRSSSVASPLLLIRLILFFTPLASMCLVMYRADYKNVSLISFILSIINHGFDMGAWRTDYLFAVLAIVCVILLSLAVIINSLFSSTKHGTLRNFIFSLVNTFVFGVLSFLVCRNGGEVRIGFYITLAIYAAELILHYVTADKKSEILLILSALVCIAIGIICATRKAPLIDYPLYGNTGDISVVSFNTAAPWGTPFDDTAGADRAKRFTDYMKVVSPELIGTQELNSSWLEAINAELPEYESYAVKRGGDSDENRSEMNGIFWLKQRFSALETHTFWLTDTPETESRFTYTDENGEEREAGCNRICSYAILSDAQTGKTVAFMNTHLDNSSEEAMNFGAGLICERINEIKEKYDGVVIILTGDFNQTDDGIAYKTITAVLNDTTDKQKQCATWQDWGYTDTGDKPIDFIFTSAEGTDYQVLDFKRDGYISDHFGIKADIAVE